MIQDLQALDEALTKAMADRIAAESRARLTGDNGANADALANIAISQLRQKRAEVASDYAKMLAQFQPGYPPAQALMQQRQALDAAIAREEARVKNARAGEFQEALNRERVLQDKVEELKSRLDLQQQDSIQYNIYQREVDTNRELYSGLLQRYKEIGVAGVAANNIAIVDVAEVPNKHSSPRLGVNIALSFLLGVLSRITTIMFVVKQAAARIAALADSTVSRVKRFDIRHGRQRSTPMRPRRKPSASEEDRAYGVWGQIALA